METVRRIPASQEPFIPWRKDDLQKVACSNKMHDMPAHDLWRSLGKAYM